jgi:lipid-A-disaccharide synthase
MIESAELISSRFPGLKCILPIAPTISDDLIRQAIKDSPVDIKLTRNDIYGTLSACDLALVASGTATLETAMMNTPMVIVYKVSLFSYLIGRSFVKVPFIGLANLVAGEAVVPELIQRDANPRRLADEALSILEDDRTREQMREKLRGIKNALGIGGASKRTAEIAVEMIRS